MISFDLHNSQVKPILEYEPASLEKDGKNKQIEFMNQFKIQKSKEKF